MIRAIPALLTLILLSLAGAPSYALTIDFEEYNHGEILFSSQGVGIRTTNTGGGPDLGVAFDSNLTGTADQDLQFNSPTDPGPLSRTPGSQNEPSDLKEGCRIGSGCFRSASVRFPTSPCATA